MPARGPRELLAEASALLAETAALLAESMNLAADMQKQLRACGIEPPARAASLLARYQEFVRRTDA